MTVHWVYILFNRNQWGALTKWLAGPAYCWWHMSSESLHSMKFDKYLWHTFNGPGIVPDAWDPLVDKTYKNPCPRRVYILQINSHSCLSLRFAWQLKNMTPSTRRQKRLSGFSTQFLTYKITIGGKKEVEVYLSSDYIIYILTETLRTCTLW